MDRRTPKMGETVIYYEGDAECADGMPHLQGQPYDYDKRMEIGRTATGTNGQRFHPAMVTQVWGDTCVNLTVFFSAHKPGLRSSACLLPDFEADVHCVNSGWRFKE